MERCVSEKNMPGFRFHPTEEELLEFYLRRSVNGKNRSFSIISTINLYLYDPWDLPALAKMGEREWYFFVPRERRRGNGGRPNRTTERGFWKASGSDRSIRSVVDPRRLIGFKKTLVYYHGRAPRGIKTEWVMNEYCLPDISSSDSTASMPPLEDIVICKVYRKATTMKKLEQLAAMDLEESRVSSMAETTPPTSSSNENLHKPNCDEVKKHLKEDEEVHIRETVQISSAMLLPPVTLHKSSSSFRPQSAMPKKVAARQLANLPAIQVPKHSSFDWNQIRSPWLEQWSPVYAPLLNF